MRGHRLRSSYSPKKILGSYDPNIVVHTIALENASNRKLMETIADSKGGQFRFVEEPLRKGDFVGVGDDVT